MRLGAGAAVVLVFLGGCGGSQPDAGQDRDAAGGGTTADSLTQPLDRAKAVQQTVDQQAAKLRRRVEEAEKGDQPQ
jgi:hypothetical protein